MESTWFQLLDDQKTLLPYWNACSYTLGNLPKRLVDCPEYANLICLSTRLQRMSPIIWHESVEKVGVRGRYLQLRVNCGFQTALPHFTVNCVARCASSLGLNYETNRMKIGKDFWTITRSVDVGFPLTGSGSWMGELHGGFSQRQLLLTIHKTY